MARCAVWLAASAEAEARRISRWWVRHRRAAPRMFDLELARALELVAEFPEVGRPVRHPVHGDVLLLYLRGPGVQVFYRYFATLGEAGVLYIRHVRRRPIVRARRLR